jgi:hypothetical protein
MALEAESCIVAGQNHDAVVDHGVVGLKMFIDTLSVLHHNPPVHLK